MQRRYVKRRYDPPGIAGGFLIGRLTGIIERKQIIRRLVMTEKKRSRFQVPHTYVLLLVMVLICAVLALIIPRDAYETAVDAATGKTILEEIQDVRFEKVCELLVTDVPIGHIASQCGMRSDSFLKRFFKARTGMTLREWRNAHRLT